MTETIAFLGAGNMGSTLISAVLKSNTVSPENVRVCDRSAEKLKIYAEQNISVSENPEDVIENTKFVVLATKPQDAGKLLERLSGVFQENTVLVSIAAGLNVKFIQSKSGIQKIVRVMPNTPALYGKGVTGIYSSPVVSEEEQQFVHSIFEGCGVVIPCSSEDQIDAITALSGSGPAYFFRILEIMTEKAVSFGFSKDDAEKIALETLRGSGEIALQSEKSFTELREMVTSKGGTTEAALEKFSELELQKTFNAGIDAAYERAKELGK